MLLLALLLISESSGRVGRTGLQGSNCGSCHFAGSFGGTAELLGPSVVGALSVAAMTLRVTYTSPPGGCAGTAGFNVAVPAGQGVLASTDARTQVVSGELTHTVPRAFPAPCAPPKFVDIPFTWTAPTSCPSSVCTVFAIANVADGTGSEFFDEIVAVQRNITVCPDDDGDGVCNASDNCVNAANPGQENCDGDGLGNACDTVCFTTGPSGVTGPSSCLGQCVGGIGNAWLDLGEACDDGNALDDGNGCSASGQKNNVCGNGSIESVFEACDDDNATGGDYCSADCTTVTGRCGDNSIQGNEACDDGNTLDDGNGCSATCTKTAVCGNSVVEAAFETCDDGNVVSGDYCAADCTSLSGVCGDSVRQNNEACDDGNTLDDGNGCTVACQKASVCGDSVVQSAFEACDDGNIVGGDGCSADCSILEIGWSCADGQVCRNVCGDGFVVNGERCDDGAANSDTAPDACRSNCSLPNCGDGVIDSGEQCDSDNSDVLADHCRTTCRLPRCGDGVRDIQAGEACDDGNVRGNDGCSPSCQNEACGNSVVDHLEECDNGSGNDDALPDACRTACVAAYCGDGIIDTGEVCDGGDACLANCTPATCENGACPAAGRCGASSPELAVFALLLWVAGLRRQFHHVKHRRC